MLRGAGGQGAAIVAAAAATGRLARTSAAAAALQSAAALRAYASGGGTVFSWGRGLEGQCGIEGGPASAAVVPRPTPLIELHGRAVARLSAGRLSSAAVTDEGEALTWGDGRSGLLALGSGRAVLRVQAPQRVEALYGRAHVDAVALGDSHALFVSGDGAAFACGENKEGQCGLGTPLEVLAAQHRRALGSGSGPGGAAVAANAARLRDAVLSAIRGGRPSSSSSSSSSSPSSASSSSSSSAVSGGWRSAAAAAAWGPPGAGGAAGAGASRRGGGSGGGGGGGGGGGFSHQQQPPQQTSLRDFVHAVRPGGGGGGGLGSGGGHGGSGFSPSAAFAAPSPLHAGWAGAGASAQRVGGAAEVARAGGLCATAALGGGGGGGGGLGSVLSSGGGGVGTGWDSVLQPGQVGHPVRVGSDRHALWGENDDEDDDRDDDAAAGAAGNSSSSSSSSSSGEPSLFAERVVAASASRYCSALLTARGEVFTFGSDFNGALGSSRGASWQPSPRRVGGALGAALADGGGAAAVAMGGGFAAAVTREGGVLLWGRLGTAGGGGAEQEIEEAAAAEGAWQMGPPPTPGAAAATTKRRRGGGAAAPRSGPSSAPPRASRPVPGAAVPAWALGGGPACPVLPHRITSVAAGQRHVLFSDGERVWAAGAWLDSRGRPAGSASLSRPKLLLDLACEGGVSRLAAGPHSSAVVSGDGRLYLWGRLLDRSVAEEAWRGAAAMAAAANGGGDPSWVEAALQRQRAAADFSWAGFGGDRPRLVPELTGVRDVALGGHHALVLAD